LDNLSVTHLIKGRPESPSEVESLWKETLNNQDQKNLLQHI
jgi:hypothetical protein